MRYLPIIGLLGLIVVMDCYVISDSNQAINSITTSSDNSSAKPRPLNNQSLSDNSTSEDSATNQLELEQYWLNQRDIFFNQTSFNLSKATNDLVGEDYANRTYHLPFWFDYEMFKNLTERVHTDNNTALKRHHIYVDNCVNIWKNSALKRLHRPNNYTFIDHAEDWVSSARVFMLFELILEIYLKINRPSLMSMSDTK